MIFIVVERSCEEVCEVVRFNVSLWASVTRPFFNYELGLILLD